MFDFIKDKFNKTIKDASESIDEEELEIDEEKAEMFDQLESDLNDLTTITEPEPEPEPEPEEEDEKKEIKEEVEEIKESEEVEKTDDNTSNDDNKGRFGFLRRNKIEETEDEPEETKNEPEEAEDTTVEEDKKEDKEDNGGRFSFITKKTINEDDIEDVLEELQFSLLEGDVAYDVAEKIVESVKDDLVGRKIGRRSDMALYTTNALKSSIEDIIDNGSYDLIANIEESKARGEPYKIMFVGINGTGKTTTIAKLAKYLENHGYTSVLGASDTFRAGAIEQLEHHANNLNLKIIKHSRNSDPAAVAFDTVEHAKATGKDVVLIDTSGRMQTNVNLMDEMKKIKRVSNPDIVLYVGDALMGNDATEQATKFNEVIELDGIILTKADADAKGGAALSIGHVISKPILFIGVGQGYDDLMEFKPEWMINQIFDSEVEA